ncbi:MAG TPA: MBL fold metallo-hydrolase [Burkholderiales bacterium]|nr:MBL fold metallo-hydrolase [Burkholderiales bacterium]
MRFAVLGSGSQGNALVVEGGRTRLLLDCGFSVSETVRRLQRLGLSAEDLTAVLVTHEHDDHIGGVARLARKFRLPVWLTPGTLRGLSPLFEGVEHVHMIEGYTSFCIGELEIAPFPVPHDAREPAQYVFSDGVRKLGVLTDIGCSTILVTRMLSGCDAIVLECNHCPELLSTSEYPLSLKQRIAGRYGHLDNPAAAALLASLDQRKLKHVIAAHLSENNNRPLLAQMALASALGCNAQWVGVADQSTGLGWRDLTG